jgi:membrane-associated HD superfamily phosphohydrolase
MKRKDLKERILKNIEKDRSNSQKFLDNISEFLKSIGDASSDDNGDDNNGASGISGEDYSKIMISAAKLIETSAKANEQVVKVLELAGERSELRGRTVPQDNHPIVLEDVWDRILIVGEIFVKGPPKVPVNVLQLHEKERKSIHKADDICSTTI